MFCDVLMTHGRHPPDPRGVLERAAGARRRCWLPATIHPEIEFYLLQVSAR